ncbi:hemerythrin domain-containing protein [Jatrophihabitans fulvus]
MTATIDTRPQPVRPASLPTGPTAVGAAAEMRTIHTIFRRELRLAPALIRSVEHGDRLRAAMVNTHLDLLDRFLHHHHTIEDDMVWPILLDRVAGEIAPLVELMEAQHATVARLLEEAQTVRGAWRTTADAGTAHRLADVYGRMHDALLEHLEAEERHVMPLVERALSKKEWLRIAKKAQRSMPLKDGPRVLGMMAYDGDPDVVREMLGAVPGPFRSVVIRMGHKAYAKHATRVYGTPTP